MKGKDVTKIEFTPEQIAKVRESIKRARADCEEWARASRVDPIKMITPIGPISPR